ncbi:MAG: glycosyltransferase family 2 protein [Bacteroidota bacterium]
MSPIVSIIIPAYNAEPFLGETIQSVIHQEFTDWELIIVDDGSTDKTQIIVEKFTSDPRITYLYKKNEGVSLARNSGFTQSKGAYVAFLDADDLWKKDRLEKMLSKFEGDSALGLVHSYVQEIDENSQLLPTVYRGKEGYILESLLLGDGCNIPAPSSILLKREVVDTVGGFNPELSTSADKEFFFRVASKFKIGMVQEILGLYRIHSNNMHSNIDRMEADNLKAYRLAEKNNLFKSEHFRRKCFANMYYILGNCYRVLAKNKAKWLTCVGKSLLYNPILLKRYLKDIYKGKYSISH